VLADGHLPRHVAAGLAKEPDGRAVDGLAETGADEAGGAVGAHDIEASRDAGGTQEEFVVEKGLAFVARRAVSGSVDFAPMALRSG